MQPHAANAAGRPDQLVVALVQRHGVDVGHHRVLVAPDPIEGVRRHMHQMAGPRRQQGQPLAIGQRPVRIVRPFGQMDVQVNSARIVRLDRQGVLQDRHGAGDGRIGRLAVLVPPFAIGLEHPGVGGDRGDRYIVGMMLCDPVHGTGVTQGAGLLLGGIALDQRVDHLALHRRGVAGQTPRVTRDAQACGDRLGVAAAAVQVRPDRPGLAPGAHAARRVQLPRLPERPHRFRMLERPAQSNPVVEPGLGLGVLRIDRETLVAEAWGHDHVACRLDIADRADPPADLRIGDQGQGRRRRRGVGDRHGCNQTGDRNRRDPQTFAHLGLPLWRPVCA